ncbi:hypothetical protein RLIN73S_04227 [Rhodanobacter lindaniclasticus]
MTRGDFVTIAMQGDFGKPRPALVIQADPFNEHATVTVLPVTGTLVAAPLFRITVQPIAENGLQKPSQIMVDKAMTVKRDKLGQPIGRIDADAMVEVERCLRRIFGDRKIDCRPGFACLPIHHRARSDFPQAVDGVGCPA